MVSKVIAKRFKIELFLRCPGIFDGFNTLESLLAAAIHEQTGLQRESALAHVPLVRLGDLWMASGMYFSGYVGQTEQVITRARRRSEIGPDYFEGRQRKSKLGRWHVDQGSGDFKRLYSTYHATECRRLVWYAEGDPEACQDLLLSLQAIGKRRGQGFGEIESCQVHLSNVSAIIDARGLVRRPIPLTMLGLVEGAADAKLQRIAVEAWKHPFWDCERVACAVPDYPMLDYPEHQRDSSVAVCPEVFFS